MNQTSSLDQKQTLMIWDDQHPYCPNNYDRYAVIRQNELFHKNWKIEFFVKTDYLESNLNFFSEI